MINNWIYVAQEDIETRYVLGEAGVKPLICIGVNPSTAMPNKLDRTLTRVKDIAINNGYDGWIMLNVYPLRKTNPDELPQTSYKDICKRNIDEIQKVLDSYPESDILCAWGTIVEKRIFFKELLNKLVKYVLIKENHKLKCLDITKHKHPKHPLYCKKCSNLIPFDIENYPFLK